MFDFNSEFVTDKNLENHGVWVPLSEGSRIKLARVGNPRSAAYSDSLSKGDPDFGVSEEVRNQRMRQVFAKTIIVDWEGIGVDGQEVPYSYEQALDMLERSDDFFKFVIQASSNHANYKGNVEAAGNSSAND